MRPYVYYNVLYVPELLSDSSTQKLFLLKNHKISLECDCTLCICICIHTYIRCIYNVCNM